MRRFLMIAAVVLIGPPAARAQLIKLNAVEIAPGIYRGRAPRLPRHYGELQQMGVRAILDIRGNQPSLRALERRRLAGTGIIYEQVPLGFRPLRDGSGEAVLAALQNPPALPLYVHCNIDRDRSSAILAIYRMRVQGWSREAAVAEAKSFGLRRYFVGLNRYLRSG
jgi:protein tyrosine/serine phosphatase